MTVAETVRAEKAKQLRYKKPIVKDLCFDSINEGLWEIVDACGEVHWFFDDKESAGLLEQMVGDEDDVYEFRMQFADLEAEADRMQNDLNETWVPECFDILFAATAPAGMTMLGYDEYEDDYFGLGYYERECAESESRAKLKRMTKDELLDAQKQCLRIAVAWMGLRYRYDCLKAAMDILRDDNASRLKQAKRIHELYEANMKEHSWEISKDDEREWNSLLNNLPGEAWIA